MGAVAYPGDVLKVKALYKGTSIWHYGILTESNTIVDHGPDGTWERSIEEFSGGCQMFLEKHMNPNVSRIEVIQRARQFIGKLNYDAISLNCEHFINHCRKGRLISKQVQKGIGGAALLLVFVVSLICISRRN